MDWRTQVCVILGGEEASAWIFRRPDLPHGLIWPISASRPLPGAGSKAAHVRVLSSVPKPETGGKDPGQPAKTQAEL